MRRLIIFLSLSTILFSIKGFSCSCAYGPGQIEEVVDFSDYVFQVVNLKNDTVDQNVYANLEVTKIWKGSHPGLIRVQTGFIREASSMCYENLLPDQSYIIFGNYDHDSTIHVGLCNNFDYTNELSNNLSRLVSPLSVENSIKPAVWYSSSKGKLMFSNPQLIEEVYVYNTQGQLLSNHVNATLPKNQLLIVVAKTSRGIIKERIFTKPY